MRRGPLFAFICGLRRALRRHGPRLPQKSRRQSRPSRRRRRRNRPRSRRAVRPGPLRRRRSRRQSLRRSCPVPGRRDGDPGPRPLQRSRPQSRPAGPVLRAGNAGVGGVNGGGGAGRGEGGPALRRGGGGSGRRWRHGGRGLLAVTPGEKQKGQGKKQTDCTLHGVSSSNRSRRQAGGYRHIITIASKFVKEIGRRDLREGQCTCHFSRRLL